MKSLNRIPVIVAIWATGLPASGLLYGFPAEAGASGGGGSISFDVMGNYTLSHGYLDYDHDGKRIHKKTGTISDSLSYVPKLDFPARATSFVVELKSDVIIGVRKCILTVYHLEGDHVFNVTGTLFGHWYRWDGKKKC